MEKSILEIDWHWIEISPDSASNPSLPILSARSSRTFCWLDKTFGMPAKISGFIFFIIFSLTFQWKPAPVQTSLWHYCWGKLWKVNIGSNMAKTSSILDLSLNVRSFLLQFSNDDQETTTWVPIWSSALPQLSTVNIQLSGD